MRLRPIALAAVASLVATVGCHHDQPAHPDDGQEHVGHVIPAHKPKSVPDAVRRLRELHGEIAARIRGATPAAKFKERTIPMAIDIASWLPEIAADSDMPEPPWNEVNERSATLAANFQKLDGGGRGDTQAALNEADQAIASLETIVARADPRWFSTVLAADRHDEPVDVSRRQ